MSRYIDADKFLDWLNVGHHRPPGELCFSEGDVKDMIDQQPTADVVEVVRCKDCRYSEEAETVFGIVDYACKRLLVNCLSADDFCNYGERREKEG